MQSRTGEIFNTARMEEMWKVLAFEGELGESSDGKQLKKYARATYDFAVNGGAISDINLGPIIPVNAIVTRVFYQVKTTFTSATDAAEVGLQIDGASPVALKASTAISAGGNVWDAGIHEGAQTGTAANMSAVTESGQIQLTIATEVLTAGKLVVIVEYVIGE